MHSLRPLAAALCLFTAIPFACAEQPAAPDPTPADLVATMIDPSASWEERGRAEDALLALRPEDVLPILLPRIAQGMPSTSLIYNGSTREAEKDGPIEWQIYYACTRIWNHHADPSPTASVGPILARMLLHASNTAERNCILEELYFHWSPEVEPALAKILADEQEQFPIRSLVAHPLILHGAQDYQSTVIGFAKRGNLADRMAWAFVLANLYNRNRTGVDPRVVQLCFELIQEHLVAQPDDVAPRRTLAGRVAAYLQLDFEPDRRERIAQGEYNSLPSDAQDEVANALTWWSTNRARIEAEIDQQSAQSKSATLSPQ